MTVNTLTVGGLCMAAHDYFVTKYDIYLDEYNQKIQDYLRTEIFAKSHHTKALADPALIQAAFYWPVRYARADRSRENLPDVVTMLHDFVVHLRDHEGQWLELRDYDKSLPIPQVVPPDEELFSKPPEYIDPSDQNNHWWKKLSESSSTRYIGALLTAMLFVYFLLGSQLGAWLVQPGALVYYLLLVGVFATAGFLLSYTKRSYISTFVLVGLVACFALFLYTLSQTLSVKNPAQGQAAQKKSVVNPPVQDLNLTVPDAVNSTLKRLDASSAANARNTAAQSQSLEKIAEALVRQNNLLEKIAAKSTEVKVVTVAPSVANEPKRAQTKPKSPRVTRAVKAKTNIGGRVIVRSGRKVVYDSTKDKKPK